jgi:hypothetical protein
VSFFTVLEVVRRKMFTIVIAEFFRYFARGELTASNLRGIIAFTSNNEPVNYHCGHNKDISHTKMRTLKQCSGTTPLE